MKNSSESNENLGQRASNLPHQFFQPLPPEVIRYWLEGNYTGGLAPSVVYDQLGWALMVRGFYRYVNMTGPGKTLTHRGYCVIDLFNGDIRCQGIRVYSNKDAFPNDSEWTKIVDCKHPLLWRSDVSSIRPDPGEGKARLTCALRLLATTEWKGASEIPKEFKKLADHWSSKGANKHEDPIKDAIAIHYEQEIAIRYIASQLEFDKDWYTINETVKEMVKKKELLPPLGEAFSGFMVYAEVPEPPKPVTLEGAYSTFGALTVSGTMEFTRIDDAVS